MPDDLRCPDCGVTPGRPHEIGCDVSRCPACGIQRLQCGEHADDRSLNDLAVWTGVWPGTEECWREGWWTRWTRHGWELCPLDHPGALPDLNRLLTQAGAHRLTWSREQQQWGRPERQEAYGA